MEHEDADIDFSIFRLYIQVMNCKYYRSPQASDEHLYIYRNEYAMLYFVTSASRSKISIVLLRA